MKTEPHLQPAAHNLWFILLALAPVLCAAAPPELIIVQEQYEKAVLGPHAAGKADLDTRFIAALGNAATAAKQAGNLDEVLAIQADQKRLTEKLPFPDDDAGSPETLKKLRVIYREQLAKLEAQRAANHTAFLPDYTGRLKDLEIYLTRADRIADATEVKVYRESLAAGVTAVAPPATAKPARSSTNPSSTPPVDAGPKVSSEEASRQLAEWAVQNGHTATVVGKKGSVVIKTAQDIPKDQFDLIKIEKSGGGTASTPPPWRLFQFTANMDQIYLQSPSLTLMPTDMAMLHKLTKLKSLQIMSKVEDVSGVVQAMPALPSLTRLDFSHPVNGNDLSQLVRKYPKLKAPALCLGEPLSESEFAVVSGWKYATTMQFYYIKAPLTQAQVMVLAKMAITTLGFLDPHGVPLELSAAELLPKITTVEISFALPEKQLDGICALPGLESLTLNKIQALDDAALVPLTAATKLKSLNLGGATNLTDAALDQLKGLKKLKSLNLKDTNISAAAIAAFKKEWPDVTVEK